MAFASGSAYAYSPATFPVHVPDGLQVVESPDLGSDPICCRPICPVMNGETQILVSEGLNRECFYARVVYRTWRSWKFPSLSDSAAPWNRNKCPMQSCDARFEDIDAILTHLEMECKALKDHADSMCSGAQTCPAPIPASVTTRTIETHSQCSQCHSTWCRAKSLFKNNKTLGLRRINSLHDSFKKRRKTSPLPDGTTDRADDFPCRASSTASSVPPPYSETLGPVEVQALEPALELDSMPNPEPVELPASAPTYHNINSPVDCEVRDAPSKSLTSVSDMSETTASSRGQDSLLSVYSRPTTSSWSTTMSLPPICTTVTPVDRQGPVFTDALTLSPVETDNGEDMDVSPGSLLSAGSQIGPMSAAVSPVSNDNGDKRRILSEPLTCGPGAATTPMALSPVDANNRHMHISSEQQLADKSGAASNTMALFHVDSNNRFTSSEGLHNSSNTTDSRHIPAGLSQNASMQSPLVSGCNSNLSRPVLSSNTQWMSDTVAVAPPVAPGLMYKYLPTCTASEISKSFQQPSFIHRDPIVQQPPIARNTSHPAPIQASFTTEAAAAATSTMSSSGHTSPAVPTAVSAMTPIQAVEASPATTYNIFVEVLERLKVSFSNVREALANCGRIYGSLPDLKDEGALRGGLDTMSARLMHTEDELSSQTTYQFCFAYLALAMADEMGDAGIVKGFREDVDDFVNTEGESGLTWTFVNTAVNYLRALNHYVPTIPGGQEGEAVYDQEEQRRLQVFLMMYSYLHRNPSPRRPSAGPNTYDVVEPVVTRPPEPPRPRPRTPGPRPATLAVPAPPIPVAASPPALAPQPAATATPTSRKRRRRDEPVEMCCRPCGYYPKGSTQQKKLARHKATIKHNNLMVELGFITPTTANSSNSNTAVSTPAAAGTPFSAGTTTPASFASDIVPKFHCPVTLSDGTPCPQTFTRKDNMKTHIKKKHSAVAPHVEPEEDEQQQQDEQEDMAGYVYGNVTLDFNAYLNAEDDGNDRAYGKRVRYSQHDLEDGYEDEEVDVTPAQFTWFNNENQRPSGLRLRYDEGGHPLGNSGFWSGL